MTSSVSFNPASDRWLTVVIGAGASLDCNTNAEVAKEWQPPIAKELFANRPVSFNPILNRYPGAERLSGDIRDAVGRNESFEAVLGRFRDSQNPNVRRNYRHVPLYIQHVIGAVTEKYFKTGATAFDSLVRALDDSDYTRVLYLTLNYDLFLEKALSGHYGVTFATLADYVSSPKWNYVKLHGCVSWNRRVTNRIVITERSNAGALRILDSLGNHDLEFSPSIEIFDGYEGTSRFQQAMSSGPTDFYYPALAVPVDHKTNESFICPQDHIDLAKTFIRNSADFLFLGFSALDTHVVDLFRDAQRVHRLLVVDRADDEASHIIERISRVNPIFAPPAHVGLANPPNYNGTFQQFIKSNYLRTVFLQSSQTVGVYNPAHI